MARSTSLRKGDARSGVLAKPGTTNGPSGAVLAPGAACHGAGKVVTGTPGPKPGSSDMTSYIPAKDRYQSVPYRRCGRSGLLLPAVSLGLWQNFGDDRPIETQRAILRRAFDLGITHFDLANNYGPPYGSAETNFARILHTDFRHHRDELVISTKAGWDMWPGPYGDLGSRKYLLASLDQSLERLGLDYVDIFYHHHFDPGTPLAETLGALHSAVTSGKALYVGISSYSDQRTAEAVAILRGLGTPLLIHQPSYSMLNRWIEGRLLDVLADRRRRVHRLLRAGAGPAQRPVPQRCPPRLQSLTRRLTWPGDAQRRQPRPHPGAQRHRPGPRPVPRPDGHRLGLARPSGHLGVDRCQQRGPTRAKRRCSRPPRFHPR